MADEQDNSDADLHDTMAQTVVDVSGAKYIYVYRFM